jgi:hypothetical protein
MVLPWFGVIVDREIDPENILSVRQDGCVAATPVSPAAPISLPNVPTLPFPNLGIGR